jgi:Tfp pilus assembly protein PilV
MTAFHRRILPAAERGLTLVEALIAVLVLALGLLVVARLQPQLRQHAELARQRSEATRLGQQELERLRSFATIDATPGQLALADLVDAVRLVDADEAGSNTRYRIVRRVDATTVAHARTVDVTIEWPDRSGVPQNVRLTSLIAAIDPALSGAATLVPHGTGLRGIAGRSIQVPLDARDLGDGRSALKPTSGATEAWVFDNRTGMVNLRCSGIAADRATQDLSTADLSTCTRLVGMVVSGEVRFSAAVPPAPEAANDAPLPLSMVLALDGSTPPIAPWCGAEAMKTVSYVVAGDLRIEAVPLAATPASRGLTTWTDRGERFVAYRCVVVPPVGVRTWSGRTTIVPSGWTIGVGGTDWRVCRYASDQDGSGAVDANAEHPAIYQNVDRALARQNFLVVRGDASCPAPDDGRTEARLTTVQHQP